MPYRLLACDYDETLAMHGTLSDGVAEALAAARRAGWRLALVTGRAHDDLHAVCPRLDLFDLVVCENGGVLLRPHDGLAEDLSPPADPRLRRGLVERRVEFVAGRTVTITYRRDEALVREAIDAHRVACDIFCNRYAVMVVSPGTSKATGLRQALARLGIAAEDVVAVGDDENDFAMMAVAGLRVAVGNAIDTLKAQADVVLDRPNGAGVAAFIHERLIAAPHKLPPPVRNAER